MMFIASKRAKGKGSSLEMPLTEKMLLPSSEALPLSFWEGPGLAPCKMWAGSPGLTGGCPGELMGEGPRLAPGLVTPCPRAPEPSHPSPGSLKASSYRDGMASRVLRRS